MGPNGRGKKRRDITPAEIQKNDTQKHTTKKATCSKNWFKLSIVHFCRATNTKFRCKTQMQQAKTQCCIRPK